MSAIRWRGVAASAISKTFLNMQDSQAKTKPVSLGKRGKPLHLCLDDYGCMFTRTFELESSSTFYTYSNII